VLYEAALDAVGAEISKRMARHKISLHGKKAVLGHPKTEAEIADDPTDQKLFVQELTEHESWSKSIILSLAVSANHPGSALVPRASLTTGELLFGQIQWEIMQMMQQTPCNHPHFVGYPATLSTAAYEFESITESVKAAFGQATASSTIRDSDNVSWDKVKAFSRPSVAETVDQRLPPITNQAPLY